MYSDLLSPMNQLEKTHYQMIKQPRQARSKATVEAILEAATRILVTSGYASATTNSIARYAGVGIGSLYEYFPNKEAIFTEIRRREAIKHFQRLTGIAQSTHPKAMLEHMISTHIAFVRDHLEIYIALETQVPRLAFEETEKAVLDKYAALSNAFLASRQADLRPRQDITFISELLSRIVLSTVKDYALRAPDRLAEPDLTDALIELIRNHLLGEIA